MFCSSLSRACLNNFRVSLVNVYHFLNMNTPSTTTQLREIHPLRARHQPPFSLLATHSGLQCSKPTDAHSAQNIRGPPYLMSTPLALGKVLENAFTDAHITKIARYPSALITSDARGSKRVAYREARLFCLVHRFFKFVMSCWSYTVGYNILISLSTMYVRGVC